MGAAKDLGKLTATASATIPNHGVITLPGKP
jgi:hypothetical protein